MKKILALLMVSVALTSCFDNSEELPINEIPVTENSTDATNTEENEKNTNINDNSTGAINRVGDVLINDNSTSTGTVDDSAIIINSDEAILENEVNNLLDEFIDSLDSYDK